MHQTTISYIYTILKTATKRNQFLHIIVAAGISGFIYAYQHFRILIIRFSPQVCYLMCIIKRTDVFLYYLNKYFNISVSFTVTYNYILGFPFIFLSSFWWWWQPNPGPDRQGKWCATDLHLYPMCYVILHYGLCTLASWARVQWSLSQDMHCMQET